MSTFELVSFTNADELARAAASAWLKEVQSVGRGATAYCVALSGGRIARRFFSAVTELAKARGVGLDSVQFFWSDERCVPPSDPESNFALAREHLLAPVAIPESQIHRIHGEEPPELAAARAEAELRRLASGSRNGQPVLDLVFLGMGGDGHAASLFPGEREEVMTNPAVYRPVVASKPPPQRITLGYPAIAAARRVWVLASGAGKEVALRESLAPTGSTPLARVLKLRSQTTVFTDIPVMGPA